MAAHREQPDTCDLCRTDAFAIVMATGIISISCNEAGFQAIGKVLFWLNCCLYILLGASMVLRAVRSGREFLPGLSRHSEAIGLFTIEAGTCVIGSQFVILGVSTRLAIAACLLAAILWFLSIYLMLAYLALQEKKQAITESADGSWFLLTVSTQSLAILMSILAPYVVSHRGPLVFCSGALVMVGTMLYLATLLVILYRLVFLPVLPGQFRPSYWIMMVRPLSRPFPPPSLPESVSGNILSLPWKSFSQI